MPVDYCVCIMPLLILVSLGVALAGRSRLRKPAVWIATWTAVLFVGIYFVPGWVLWVAASCGHADSQFRLSKYYNTRLGYIWSDIEARDRWLVEAAKQGHPEAMYWFGHHSMYGTSRHIPKDYAAARHWLTAARDAGVADASVALKELDAERGPR
ncbi:MAG: hypothetical protein ABGY75_02310 [Gemmataceae bacterium]